MDRNLIEYLPTVLQEVREFKALAMVEQPEAEGLWDALEGILKEQFIEEAGDDGVSRMEKVLGIVPKATDTLDERKFRLLVRMSERAPYTLKSLEGQLAVLCGENGYSLDLDHAAYTLKVRVELTASKKIGEVESLIARISPANLVLDLSLLYNQYKDYADQTYGSLEVFTYDQLKTQILA